MRFLYVSAWLSLMFSEQAYSASIQQEALNFGTLVIPQNNTLSSITINHNGEITTFGSIYVLTEGNPAELSDEFGDLLLKVGGRLITTGTSQSYLDGSFITDTQLEITIDY